MCRRLPRLFIDRLDLEARDGLVLGADTLELLLGDDVVDVFEPVRRPLMGQLQHLIGPITSICEDNSGRGREAEGLVFLQRRADIVRLCLPETVGEGLGVQDRLRRAVGADRIHGVGGVAEQRQAAERPLRDGVAVAHGELVDFGGRVDQVRHAQPAARPGPEGRFEAGLGHAARPVDGRRREVRVVLVADAELGDPVDQRFVALDGRLRADRVRDEFLVRVPRPDHRRPRQIRVALDAAPPQDAAREPWRPFGRVQ